MRKRIYEPAHPVERGLRTAGVSAGSFLRARASAKDENTSWRKMLKPRPRLEAIVYPQSLPLPGDVAKRVGRDADGTQASPTPNGVGVCCTRHPLHPAASKRILL